MPDERLPKKVLFSQLSRGKRPQHKLKVRWRDCITNDLKDVKLSSLWINLALTRQQWRHETKQKCLDHDSHLGAFDHERRAIHRGDGSTLAGCECHNCGQRVTSKRYLKSHFTQKHSDMLGSADFFKVSQITFCHAQFLTATSTHQTKEDAKSTQAHT